MMPTWTTSKTGALGSELITKIMSEPFMPSRCLMAPLMPQAVETRCSTVLFLGAPRPRKRGAGLAAAAIVGLRRR